MNYVGRKEIFDTDCAPLRDLREVRNTETGEYQRIDLDAYLHYRRNCTRPGGGERINHALIGKRFSHKNKVVTIKIVNRQWWAGMYLLAVFEDEAGSSGTTIVANESSIDRTIIEAHARFKDEFRMLHAHS